MKKTFITLALAAFSVAVSSADNYDVLTFENSDGTQTSMSVSNLKIKVADGNLVVTNASTSATLPLASLSKMFFALSTGINIAADSAGLPVTIYTMEGIKLGTYSNTEAAKAALAKGMYVVKTADKTYKTTVR